MSNEPAESTSRDETVDVRIRRAPKLGVFIALGAALGLLVALVFTSVFEVDPNVGSTGTFAYIALYSIPLGIALAAIVGLVIDRVSKRRAKTAHALVTERRSLSADDGASADDRPGRRNSDTDDDTDE